MIFYSTGKRKTSIARVFIKVENYNKIIINNKNINEYCYNNIYRESFILSIINLLEIKDKLNIYITVKGGGVISQLNAIKHGISKALLKYNNNYKIILKKNKLLTRDSRKVERKKVGFKKSRKKSQFSKR